MSLLTQLKDAQKDAMRAKDKITLGTIRMALAEIKQREIDNQITLDEAAITSVIVKMVKQRRDAHDQFINASEISVLEGFLPKPLSEEEILQLIDQAISDCGASGMQDMGKVMGLIKSQAEGKADIGKISGLIKQRLNA